MTKPRMTPENKARAEAIRQAIASAIAHRGACRQACAQDKRADGVWDLGKPAAMDRNRALHAAAEAVGRISAAASHQCPQEERESCCRCAGEGKVWRHSNVQGGTCFRCGGRGWTASARWMRACMPPKAP